MSSIAMKTFALLVALSFAPAAAQETHLAYRLTDEWTEGNSGSTTMVVTQSEAVTAARFEADGMVALISNPSLGIRCARKDRSLPFYVELVAAPAELGVGTKLVSSFGESQVIESLAFDLQRGDADKVLERHAAQHHVLTIELVVSITNEDGAPPQRNRAQGRADLWTASELSFSWLPYTYPQGFSLAAIPLSMNHPDVAAHVLNQLAGRLEGLGLLLRAEVRNATVVAIDDGGMTSELAREVRVEGLEEVSGALDLTETSPPVLTPVRYEALLGGMMLAGSAIQQAMEAGPGALTWETDAAKELTGSGTARLFHEVEEDDASILVLGSPTDEAGCVVVFTEPRGPRPESHRIHPLADSRESAAGPKAVALCLRGNRESSQVTLLESGSLSLSKTEDGKLAAKLQGTGWMAHMTPDSASLTEDVALTVTFEVEKAP